MSTESKPRAAINAWFAERVEVTTDGTPVHMDGLADDYFVWARERDEDPEMNSEVRGRILDRPEVKRARDANMVTGIRLRGTA